MITWLFVYALHTSDGHMFMGSKKFELEAECREYGVNAAANSSPHKFEWNCMKTGGPEGELK